jgi:phosphorylated CTD-interacting factor 1
MQHRPCEPLAREIARGEALRQLRLDFGALLRTVAGSVPVVGAFERWHLHWLFAGGQAAGSDPLLPSVSTSDADAVLADELLAAGISAQLTSATVAELAGKARAACASLSAAGGAAECDLSAPSEQVGLAEAPDNTRAPAEGEGHSRVAGEEGKATLWHMTLPTGGAPLKISGEQLAKLRSLHARHNPPSERRFRHDVARLLLRYKALGGSGFQAALGGAPFLVLRECFGCSVECFASPLNARTAPFCSAFPDVDAPFGSRGSFFSTAHLEGSYEANPPFCPPLIAEMASHMESQLEQAEADSLPLLYAVVVGASAGLKRHAAWQQMQRLAEGPFGRAQWLIPLHQHGYTEVRAAARPHTAPLRRSSSPLCPCGCPTAPDRA